MCGVPKDFMKIKDSLNLKNFLEVIGNPNRPNIFYEKVFQKDDDIDFYEQLLNPIMHGLKESTTAFPLTILYLPLKWCRFSFNFFEKQLGNDSMFH